MSTARAMQAEGLVAGTEGNVSVRDGDLVHMTPADLPYEEMAPSDIVTLDLEGNVVAGSRAPSSEWRVHLAVYAESAAIGAVVHTHSPHAIRWSERGEVLPSPEGPIRTAHRADAGSAQLGVNVVAAMRGNRAVLMAGHGVVAVGATPRDALALALLVEHAAQRCGVTARTVCGDGTPIVVRDGASTQRRSPGAHPSDRAP